MPLRGTCCEALPQRAVAVMGKKKGRGRGRPKDSQNEGGERQKELGGIQKETNAKPNEPSRPNQVRAEQFQDADCGNQQLTGNNDLHFPLNSEGHKRPEEGISSDCCAPENVYSSEVNKAETSRKQEKTKDKTDVSLKNTVGASGTTYSLNSFHRTFPNSPDVNVQHDLSTNTVYVSESSKAKKMAIIRRPNFGTAGKRIEVVSNYFLLEGGGKDIYHYHVEITDKSRSPKTTKVRTIKEEKETATQLEVQQKRNVGKQKFREVVNKLICDKKLKDFWPFYDGYKNLFTFRPLNIGEGKSADVSLGDDSNIKTYNVTVKPVRKNGGGNAINLQSLSDVCSVRRGEIPLEAVMAFDMILCHRNPPFNQVGIGRSFFFFNEIRKNPIDGQVEVWKGYNNSLQLTQKGPAVLVNVASKAFHCSGFVIEYACNVLGFDITERNLGAEDIHKLKKSLRGMKVEVTHLPYPRKYTIESVTQRSADDLIVDIEGKHMSVTQFFAQKYRRLKFSSLPCLSMKTTGRPTYTPMEFCVILPGQPKLGKLNPTQNSNMIDMTAIAPSERFASIVNHVKKISEVSGPYMEQAGYHMQLTPLQLTARIISAPALAYSNVPCVQPDPRGVWRIDGKNFSRSVSNVKWILISFADPKKFPLETLKKLSFALVGASNNVGLHLNNPQDIKLFDRATTTYKALLHAKSLKVQFAFVILSRRDTYHNYEELKFIADIKLGLITQCMEDIVVEKCCREQGSSQILNNVLSKLNTKLGGINHTFSKRLSVSIKGTIVMGADAAHSPKGSKCPSIAAVVGSIDDVPFQYAVSCRVQTNPDESKLSQEIILDMKKMTKHILNSYRKRNDCFPERIIFFRDGVSQGQFQTVLQSELTSIQKACHELYKKTLPITFIIVQKRHQTRFMPKNPEEAVGKFGNVPPGTTVDTDVTHPVYFDYFLCSHEGIRGTSKPAHYVVLHDDNKFQADDIQKFCYDLCHVYARCNRSISIPAPAMNAHLAAARAKKYIDWHLLNGASSSSGYSSDDISLPEEVINFVNNISEIEAPMFFV